MYIELDTGQYPVTPEQIKERNPQWCFPDPFEPCDGYALVGATEPPVYDPATEKVVELPPVEEGSSWVQAWEVRDLTAEEIGEMQQTVLRAVQEEAQRRLDAFAQERRYDGIVSLASYATSKVEQYHKEGQYGVDMRDEVWATLRSIEDAVLAGERPLPTYEEAISELPDLDWASLPV